MNENDLKAKLVSLLSNDFEMYGEVTGTHYTGKKIRPDFIILPKQHLMEKGFDNGIIAVEVKHLGKAFGHGHMSDLNALIWQAQCYGVSSFNIAGFTNTIPTLTMIYTNDLPELHADSGVTEHYQYYGRLALFAYMQISGVGRILPGYKGGWKMTFGQFNTYYSTESGRSHVNVGVSRKIGNIK